ncbi:mycofactocin-coupled SDR family oxidoreductase [Amycolatopsis pithecellobii]|uniref:Mycofactocin-coupled SDR family oxidoreductase n=1 Tax=Amycolatopsis pithecellobii TaxID=664692 RepID=A0A6N7Z337_9PSEU|nr:mycofactocin-coupled SDR family oxidoreductase [Amycolatopsis pithecellobii]MTD54450.1 mycofactocin-coupled SDR family oxidoreductase [Amycolatopsis pithecellobii]
MATDLSGRVALITGGARGQGRSHALTLARAGADIAVCDACRPFDSVLYDMPDEDDLAETKKLVEELGRRCVAVKADVTVAAEVEDFVSTTISELGRIDFVVANAGIFSPGGPLWEISEQRFDETMAVDAKGVWLTIKYAVPHMLERRSGSIVLTSSMAGLEGNPNIGHYVAAKHAVVGLMRSLANEVGPYGIRVNALNPGTVNTKMVNFPAQYKLFNPDNPTEQGMLDVMEGMQLLPGPFTEVEDQSNAVLWLCSDESRMVSGITLPVAGGANVMK